MVSIEDSPIRTSGDAWTAINVQQEMLPQRCIRRTVATEEREDLKLFSTISIAAADRGKIYLLKVTGEGKEILQQCERDGYNCKFRKESKVIRGYFHYRCHSDVHKLTLQTAKQAMVFSETVCYI